MSYAPPLTREDRERIKAAIDQRVRESIGSWQSIEMRERLLDEEHGIEPKPLKFNPMPPSPSAREGELRCVRCRQWKPDDDFPRSNHRTKARRGRHNHCRPCNNEIKRKWREKNAGKCADCGGKTTADSWFGRKAVRCSPCTRKWRRTQGRAA